MRGYQKMSEDDKGLIFDTRREGGRKFRVYMVPMSLRSELPEFQNCTIEHVLVGIDLPWVEFLQLLNISLDASQYVLRGSEGHELSLTDKVGSYVSTLKTRMKVYPVSIEKIKSVILIPPRGNQYTKPTEGNQPPKSTQDIAMAQTFKMKEYDGDQRSDADAGCNDTDCEQPLDTIERPVEFSVKSTAVQSVVNKISNKDMLRSREELLHLREQDDYVRLMEVAPLAAKLLEQMFFLT